VAITLYGRPNSLNVQKVRWILAELELPYVHVESGRGYVEHTDQAWFLTMNPNGKVPVLDDDGTVLWESNAIVRYLAAEYDRGGLWPVDAAQRAQSDRWMDWQQTVLLGAVNPAFWQLVRTPAAERDRAVIATSEAHCNQAFALLDRALADRSYVAGMRPTIGDIPLGATAHRWYALDLDHAELPNLRRWYARLCQRPAFRDTVMLPLS
jgi:glutathione S-transferase